MATPPFDSGVGLSIIQPATPPTFSYATALTQIGPAAPVHGSFSPHPLYDFFVKARGHPTGETIQRIRTHDPCNRLASTVAW